MSSRPRVEERLSTAHSTFEKVQSNMMVQQITLRKLASRHNQEQGLGKTEVIDGLCFKHLFDSTEELLKLLYDQRMYGFRDI